MGKEGSLVSRTVAIGVQNFEDMMTNHYFYIDKTKFIKEWWENGDVVTLITRPRRFGKTLTMDMVEKFFSVQYTGRKDLFEGLYIWETEKYRKLQGTYPVLFLSFAGVQGTSFKDVRRQICRLMKNLYQEHRFLLEGDYLSEGEKKDFLSIDVNMEYDLVIESFRMLSNFLSRYYKKRVIILLDEYDTPMQEAYVGGYWRELVSLTRGLFHATFKANPYLERAIMTGITRISKESIFSGLNNLEVVTTTSEKYHSCFGFTEKEVFTALEEYNLAEQKQEVKSWYDGFTFGTQTDIYNPWSIINFLDKKKALPYWANTSSHNLIRKLITEGSSMIKEGFETLLQGGNIYTTLDEQVVFDQLDYDETAIWSLLLASGYLKVVQCDLIDGNEWYHLALTNKEVKKMFERMIAGWFQKPAGSYNAFIKALLAGDIEEMNSYMNQVALKTFSSFDVGKKPSEEMEPERFYHGFVLGLVVELGNQYFVTSNRESGFGRYDVILEPRNRSDMAYILEFKVHNLKKEASLKDTVQAALDQIEKKQYEAVLVDRGIPKEHIKKYGFAFQGKTVLIG